MYVRVHVCVFALVCVCACGCSYVCACVHACVRVYVYVHVCVGSLFVDTLNPKLSQFFRYVRAIATNNMLLAAIDMLLQACDTLYACVRMCFV